MDLEDVEERSAHTQKHDIAQEKLRVGVVLADGGRFYPGRCEGRVQPAGELYEEAKDQRPENSDHGLIKVSVVLDTAFEAERW